MCVCVCPVQVPYEDRETEASDPLELALQMLVSHQVWVLGTETRSSERAAFALKC